MKVYCKYTDFIRQKNFFKKNCEMGIKSRSKKFQDIDYYLNIIKYHTVILIEVASKKNDCEQVKPF